LACDIATEELTGYIRAGLKIKTNGFYKDCGTCGNDLTHCVIRENNYYQILVEKAL